MFKSFLSVFLSVLLLFSLFCVQLNAAEPTSVTISGEDLVGLITTGVWECYYSIGGTENVKLSSTNVKLANDYCYIVFSNASFTTGQIWTGATVYFDTGLNYDGVIGIEAVLGGNIGYMYRSGPSSSDMAFSLINMSYADGFVQGTSTIELPNSAPNAINGNYSFLYNSYNYKGNFAKLASSFESMTMRNLMLIENFTTNMQVGSGVNLPLDCIYVIKSITVHLDGTGGSSGGDSGGGSSNATQQAILGQIEEANKKLADLESSIEQGTQDIIDNQEQNTQDIIDNQDQNTQDIIDNQDKNTQDIIDKEQELWDDTYNPSDEEVSDMQDNISEVTDDLKEKLGLFTFIDDTLSQFFDLLDPGQVSSTNLVFPAMSIEVQGESYDLWDEYEYDISSLKNVAGFKLLFDCLHFLSAGIIYWALIHYLQVVFKRIFASGGD